MNVFPRVSYYNWLERGTQLCWNNWVRVGTVEDTRSQKTQGLDDNTKAVLANQHLLEAELDEPCP
jgi:hypothetical protein